MSEKLYRTEQEELLLNTVAACTNLSYYINNSPAVMGDSISLSGTARMALVPKKLQKKWILISQYLAQCLFHDNNEVVSESVKAYGK